MKVTTPERVAMDGEYPNKQDTINKKGALN